MKSSGRNISLSSLDDIFSSEETRQGGQEQIRQIPISELVPFKDHPFRVVDDDHMMETVESVKEYGVLVPIIVRPLEDGLYEIVSGHRRKRACELAGIDEIPVIIRDLDTISYRPSSNGRTMIGTRTPYSLTLSTVAIIWSSSTTRNG